MFISQINLLYRQYRGYIVLFLVVVVCLVIGWLFMLPKLSEALSIQEAVSDGQQRKIALESKLKELAFYSQDESILDEKLRQVDLSLPYDKQVGGLIFGIESLAQESSLSAKAIQMAPGVINPLSKSTTGKAGQVEVQVTFEGSIADIQLLVSKIKSARRILTLKSISLVANSKTGGLAESTIPMIAYFQSAPSNLGDAAMPLPKLSSQDLDLIDTLSRFKVYTSVGQINISGKANPFVK